MIETVEDKGDVVRSTVVMSRAEADLVKASAKRNKRGWTNELVVLAMKALQPKRGQKSDD